MRFFVPQAIKNGHESIYSDIVAAVKSQMGWRIQDRRIYSLSYTQAKKTYHLQVGEFEPYEKRYEILAILESQAFVAFTRTKSGSVGPTILISKIEVEAIEDFEAIAAKPTTVLTTG